jgi:hypothetical protein
MKIIKPPAKPFPNYKWRWAELTPSESLNSPPVFLGILRVCNRFQNQEKSSEELTEGVNEVLRETNSPIQSRTAERNIFRNSDRYWKALGLLENVHGKILVSPFGQLLAAGKITQMEFATTIVKTLELPNRRIVDDTSDWDNANLKIKPLELILEVLANIAEKYGSVEAYITPFELVKIIIPLAGAKAPLADFSDAIIQHRQELIDVSKWPDCAPSSNDKRIAREFLLFLSNYGFCNVVHSARGNENERYFLASISREEIIELHRLKSIPKDLENVVKTIRETQIPANIERKKVSREVLERRYQNVFRKNVLVAFDSTCVITGVSIENVLEASHIKAVKYNGSDKVENGLCLRSDIHQLFDSKHLSIFPNGDLILSEFAAAKNNYQKLPKQVNIPAFVNTDLLAWRVKYT